MVSCLGTDDCVVVSVKRYGHPIDRGIRTTIKKIMPV